MNPPFLIKRVHRYFVSQSLSQRTRMDTRITKRLNALNQWILQSIVQMNSDKLHVVAKETALLP